MSLASRVPLMREGRTASNVVVALGYLFLLPLLIPLVLLALPFVAAYKVYQGGAWSEKLSSLPGIEPGGGVIPALAAFAYVFVALAVVGAVTGGGDSGTPDAQAEINADATPTVQERRAISATDTPAQTDGGQTQAQNGEGDDVTATPTPKPTDSPTLTASPTPTATPTPKNAPDGESYSFDGSGAEATESFSTEGGLVVFNLAYDGDSNFAVWVLDENGEREKLLVNAIGEWDGKVAMNLPAGSYVLNVEADGNWQAGVEQPRYSAAEVGSLPQEAQGDDSTYIGPFNVDGLTRVTFTAGDDEHYAVWLKNHEGQNVELLFNKVGPFEGSTAFGGEGVAIIQVETNGEWKIVIEEG